MGDSVTVCCSRSTFNWNEMKTIVWQDLVLDPV